jgi:hypothetical protein
MSARMTAAYDVGVRSAADGYRAGVGDEDAVLILNSVKVNGRAALVSAFPDRLVVVDRDGTRTIPIADLARITHKAGVRSGRLGIVTVGGDHLEIRGLRSRDTPAAFQVLVQLASSAR